MGDESVVRNPANNKNAAAVRRILSGGDKRAKDIVASCEKKGIKESTVFYWLNRLQEKNVIRKVKEKRAREAYYKLIKLEEADIKEMELLQGKFEEGNVNVRKIIAEDIRKICTNKEVTHIEWIWEFLDGAINGNLYDNEIREKAITALRWITLNSKRIEDEKAIKQIREEFRKGLEKVVLDESMDPAYRNNAVEILDKIMPGEEFYKLSWRVLTKLSEGKQFHPARHIWRRFLDRYFPERKIEILEKIYSMMGEKDKSVREMASILHDTLRARERGIH